MDLYNNPVFYFDDYGKKAKGSYFDYAPDKRYNYIYRGIYYKLYYGDTKDDLQCCITTEGINQKNGRIKVGLTCAGLTIIGLKAGGVPGVVISVVCAGVVIGEFITPTPTELCKGPVFDVSETPEWKQWREQAEKERTKQMQTPIGSEFWNPNLIYP